jgi:hypothetical protein
MADYRLTAQPDVVIRNADFVQIPRANLVDWPIYEEWLAAGGVPDPAVAPIPTPDWSWGPMFVDVIGRGTQNHVG